MKRHNEETKTTEEKEETERKKEGKEEKIFKKQKKTNNDRGILILDYLSIDVLWIVYDLLGFDDLCLFGQSSKYINEEIKNKYVYYLQKVKIKKPTPRVLRMLQNVQSLQRLVVGISHLKQQKNKLNVLRKNRDRDRDEHGIIRVSPFESGDRHLVSLGGNKINLNSINTTSINNKIRTLHVVKPPLIKDKTDKIDIRERIVLIPIIFEEILIKNRQTLQLIDLHDCEVISLSVLYILSKCLLLERVVITKLPKYWPKLRTELRIQQNIWKEGTKALLRACPFINHLHIISQADLNGSWFIKITPEKQNWKRIYATNAKISSWKIILNNSTSLTHLRWHEEENPDDADPQQFRAQDDNNNNGERNFDYIFESFQSTHQQIQIQQNQREMERERQKGKQHLHGSSVIGSSKFCGLLSLDLKLGVLTRLSFLNIPTLKTLKLCLCAAPPYIECLNLKTLKMSWERETELESMVALVGCSHLTSLNINCSNITTSSFQHGLGISFSKLRKLKHLILDTIEMQPTDILSLLWFCKELTNVTLEYATPDLFIGIENFFIHALPELTRLEIGTERDIEDGPVFADTWVPHCEIWCLKNPCICSNIHSLILDIINNERISDIRMQLIWILKLLQGMPSLQSECIEMIKPIIEEKSTVGIFNKHIRECSLKTLSILSQINKNPIKESKENKEEQEEKEQKRKEKKEIRKLNYFRCRLSYRVWNCWLFTGLKTLHLYSDKDSSSEITSLLMNTPFIQKLIIDELNSPALFTELATNNIPLANLRALILSTLPHPTIVAEFIPMLLKSIPNLSWLRLPPCHCSAITNYLERSPYPLKKSLTIKQFMD